MADAGLQGVNYAKAIAPSPANILARGVLGGTVKVLYDSYDATSTNIDTDDTVKIGRGLKAGDIVLGAFIATSKATTNCVIDLGDSDDDDRYGTISVSSAAASNQFLGAYAGLGYTIGTNAGDTQPLITIDTAAFDGVVKVAILYVEK